jgi:hypothetical protein
VNPGAISVGSFDNVAAPNPALFVDGTPFPLSFSVANANFPAGDNTWDYVITDPDAEANQVNGDGCPGTGFKVSPAGKIAVIRFGVSGTVGYCGSVSRCNAAARAGATGCITYAPNENGLLITGSSAIPSASITNDAGKAIVAAFKAGKPATVVFNPAKQENFPIATGGTASDFSSYGMDPELWIKPDISGVGGDVFSTLSPLGGRNPYGLMSGTSMSSPYVAGTIALLLEAKKNIKFDEVKSRLVNNAQPAKIYKSELIDTVAKQGGGLVNIFNTVNAKTVVYPSSLSLNDTERTQQHYTLTINHEYKVPVTYTLNSYGAAQMNPFVEGEDTMIDQANLVFTADYANVTFRGMQSRSFKVNPGETARANVDIEPPAKSNAGLWPIFSGYITITNDQDEQVIRVPYAGMKGVWANAPIWVRKSPLLQQALANDPSYYNFGFTEESNPSVGAYLIDGSWAPVPEGTTLVNGNDGLFLTIPAATTTRGFKVEIKYVGKDRKTREKFEALGAKADGKKPVAVPYAYSVVVDAIGNLSVTPVGGLAAAYVQRNAPTAGQSVGAPILFYWDLLVYPNTTSTEPTFLPPGEYQVKFSGQKHFRRVGTIDANFDILSSATFKIANSA